MRTGGRAIRARPLAILIAVIAVFIAVTEGPTRDDGRLGCPAPQKS
jgi:hypothetical protein